MGILFQRSFRPISYTILTLILYAPILSLPNTTINAPKLAQLTSQVLRNSEALTDILYNLAGHLLLLTLLFIIIDKIARVLTLKLPISIVTSIFLVQICSLGTLISLNAWMFPSSQFVAFYSNIQYPVIGISCGSMLLVGIILIVVDSIKKIHFFKIATILATTTIAITTLLYADLSIDPLSTQNSPAPSKKTNIIIIGVDSLSTDTIEREAKKLPTISSLYKSLSRYTDTTVPLARTFPAWMSILSGKLPSEHGAHFNLTDPDFVERKDLLSRILQQQGYKTVFAMDERRFCNIDTTYGFDKVIGPKAGVLDFVIHRYNDTPHTNLALQNILSQWLFKFSYMNVSSHANYNNMAIIHAIKKELSSQPHFLAVHFLSAHFPYAIGQPARKPINLYQRYLNSLKTVDKQVHSLLEVLHNNGSLDNALLILLSDHGESFGEPEGIISRKGEAPKIIKPYGHGAKLLGKLQNRAVLAFGRYKNGKPTDPPIQNNNHVSLVDLRKLIIKQLTTQIPPELPHSKCRIMETGLRFAAIENLSTFNKSDLIQEAVGYYRINPKGRLILRNEKLPDLVSSKQFALQCENTIAYKSNSRSDLETFSIVDEKYIEIENNAQMIYSLKSYIKQSTIRAEKQAKISRAKHTNNN